MNITVTGGAGFIGSNLVKKLVELGHEIVVLDNLCRGNKIDKKILDSIRLIVGDVRDENTVMEALKGCDLIFHLAAVLGVDIVADNPVETMDTEFLGLKNLAKGTIVNSIEKIIYSSTSGVYGKSAIEKAVDEEFSVAPSTSYSIAKRFNEIYLKSLYQEKGVQSISLRFFNVYGTNQDNRMVIPRFFEQAINNKDLTVYGDGNQTRDFTYIDDVTEAMIRTAQLVEGCEIINISNNQEYTIKEVAKEIVKICDSKSEIVFIKPPEGRYDFEVERRFGSSEKLKEKIGFSPKTSIKMGLKKTYHFIKKEKRYTNKIYEEKN